VKDYFEIHLPFTQIIRNGSMMSIQVWKLAIFLDWWRDRPKGARLISIDWNPT